ncbi:MAG TPA: MFS transporter [Ktedonobacteraceae bacterium]|nr:MFS transporter [Ktedonobacteraceae bacterium]
MKAARLTLRDELSLNFLWFSLNAQSAALLPIVIPTQILLFVPSSQVGSAEQAVFLGWLTLAASLISLFMPPIIGVLSDSTPGGLGRRRPYIILGGLFLVLSTPFLVNAPNIVIFLIGLSTLHLGRNILTPAYQSLVPDRVPEEQRGEASGYVGGMTILGNVAGLALAAILLGSVSQQSYDTSIIRSHAGIFYIVTAFLIIIGVLVTVIGVREVPLLIRERAFYKIEGPRLARYRRWFVESWIKPWRSFNFTLVFITRSLIMLGLALFMTYIEYYFARVQHVTNFVAVTAGVAVLALCGGVISGVVFGILSDRFKRRAPIVCISTLCMSAASLAFVIFPSTLTAWLWPLGILFGLGNGAYSSVDWALSIDALPSLEQAGKDLGLWNASATLPAIIAPLLGSLIISIADQSGHTELGYRLVFTAATLFLVIAAIGVLFVRETRHVRKQ